MNHGKTRLFALAAAHGASLLAVPPVLQAAETGHLVIGTMPANTSTTAIERIIELFPPEKQQQKRKQLAEVFLLILNQHLIPRKNGNGRALAYEKLANTARIGSMIREGNTHHIRTNFQNVADEFHHIDSSLSGLVQSGEISLEEGIKYCENPAEFRDMASRKPEGSSPGGARMGNGLSVNRR